MQYIKSGRIQDIENTNKKKYESYLSEYIPFLKDLAASDQRAVDKALFAFGKFLKVASLYV